MAAKNDPFWHVRSSALGALADSGDSELTALLRERYEQDDSYFAQAAALRALGRHGSSDDIPFLEAADGTASPRDVLRSAANQALRRIQGGQ